MKVDLKKTISSYKAKNGVYSLVDVPALRYLMIDGENGPASTEYISAIEALYPVAYKLKFMSKQLDMPDLNTDPDDLDLDELETIVLGFVNTIDDR